MNVMLQNALRHGAMVFDLAMSRAICNHTTIRVAEMQNILKIECEIAFDELKSENHWAWNDLQELREAHAAAISEYEKEVLASFSAEIGDHA